VPGQGSQALLDAWSVDGLPDARRSLELANRDMGWSRLIFAVVLLAAGGALIAFNAMVSWLTEVRRDHAPAVAPIFVASADPNACEAHGPTTARAD